MVNKGLVDYIDNLVRQGYNIDYIRNYLVSYGYNPQEVDQSITYLYSIWQSQRQQYNNIGAQPGNLQQVNIQQQNISQQAFPSQPANQFQSGQQQILPGEVSSKNTLPKIILISLVVVILLGVGGFFLYTNYFSGQTIPQTLLDLEINMVKTEYYPGDSLEFVASIQNMGTKNRFDIQIISRILKSGSNAELVRKEEVRAIETRYSGLHSLAIPESIEPGQYLLDVSSNYGAKTAKASQLFTVKSRAAENETHAMTKNETCGDGLKNQDETGIDCGGKCNACPSCEDSLKNQGETGVDCGGPCKQCEQILNKETCADGILNQNEEKIDCGGPCAACPEDINPRKIISEVRDTAASDPKGALRLCQKIDVAATKDECIKTLATSGSDASYCEIVSAETKKDACFMFFVLQGDYSLCVKIVNPSYKQSCESMQQLESQRNAAVDANVVQTGAPA